MQSKRPWISHYPDGIPADLSQHPDTTIVDFFDECFRKYSRYAAFENMGKSLTYSDVDKLSNDFASYLINEAGLKPGDRIAIQLPNVLQFPVVMIGALKAGLIVVNTNPLYTPREMKHQFNDSGAVAIVILANFAHNLEKIIGETPIKKIIVTEIGDLLGGLKKTLVNFVVKHVKKMVSSFYLPQAVPLLKALDLGKRQPFNKQTAQKEDVIFLQYTGGTTGLSKGAQLTHANLIAHNLQFTPFFQLTGLQDKAVGIVPLPMYHIFALSFVIINMYFGFKSLLITNPRDIPGFIKAMKKQKFNMIIGVNTLFNALLNNPSLREADFSALRFCGAGGMALQETVAKRWKDVTGVPITEGYGLSETSPVLTFNLPGKERPGTIGIPITSTEIAIMDDNGNELPPGETGELCARGPQVFKGYWQYDNSNVFHPGGWFKTGDIAAMDEDGYFRIVDRKKDMILVSGFNVYPNEIENEVAKHPKVLEVAAVGIKDDQCGEVVKLFIVKRDESLTEEEVSIYCKENFTGYKRPKHIEFRKELPKTNVGKIMRRSLREGE